MPAFRQESKIPSIWKSIGLRENFLAIRYNSEKLNDGIFWINCLNDALFDLVSCVVDMVHIVKHSRHGKNSRHC